MHIYNFILDQHRCSFWVLERNWSSFLLPWMVFLSTFLCGFIAAHLFPNWSGEKQMWALIMSKHPLHEYIRLSGLSDLKHIRVWSDLIHEHAIEIYVKQAYNDKITSARKRAISTPRQSLKCPNKTFHFESNRVHYLLLIMMSETVCRRVSISFHFRVWFPQFTWKRYLLSLDDSGQVFVFFSHRIVGFIIFRTQPFRLKQFGLKHFRNWLKTSNKSKQSPNRTQVNWHYSVWRRQDNHASFPCRPIVFVVCFCAY